MGKRKTRVRALLAATGFLMVLPVFPQENQTALEELKKTAAKVFLDCGSCDLEYIKNEITFVNYVRDRKEAHVHVLVTTQPTGSGGREYTLTFIGQNGFADVNDIQKYFSNKTDTEDDIRRGLVKALKLGLMSYVGRTPISSRISINYLGRPEAGPARDKWDFWLFSLSASGHFMGEETYADTSLDSSFSANRVTQRTKVRLSLSLDNSRNKYVIEDETIQGIRRSWDASGLFVWSLGEHWSAGFYLEADSSTYSNIDSYITVAPALEYNVFRYSESTRRQLRFLYRIGWNQADYIEETIYAKTQETLFNQSLRATMDVQEPWGSISASVEGSHYLHDFKKARLELRSYLSFRVFKGLSVDVNGRYDIIHDQLSLPAGDLTIDEILLRRKELATGYDYSISFGFRYTFGSVFSNVVNPRFGGTRRYGH